VSISDLRLQATEFPDIYIIILDAYARSDVLSEIYQYDNSEFLANLEARGFYIADQVKSNYVQTPYSIGSLLNFDYAAKWKPPSDYFKYLHDPIENNRAFSALRTIGYRVVTIDNGFSHSNIGNADIRLSPYSSFNEFETFLLADSPVETLSEVLKFNVPTFTYNTHRKRVLFALEELKKLPSSTGPKVVFAHILSPHPPFVLDDHGNNLQPQRAYGIWDGNEFQGNLKEYWTGYKNQLVFVNTKIIEIVDGLQARSITPPIIIIMSDHGPGSLFHWNPEAPGCLWERTGNFFALSLPGKQLNDVLYPSISPVNAFRVIFNLYFGENLNLLPDKSFMTAWSYQDYIGEITDKIGTIESCQSLITKGDNP
jgi:hypothetical protein